MVSQKILNITDCCFNLPDNFNGSLGDALMLLAKKRLEQEKENCIKKSDNDDSCYTNLMKHELQKCYIKYSITKLSEDGKSWINM